MKEAKDVLRIVGVILLALFVVVVVVPFALTLVFKIAGVTLGILGILIWLAVMVIKIAVVVAIIYLIVVGIRAVLK